MSRETKITNKYYKKFLEENEMQFLRESDIQKVLEGIKDLQGKALVSMLYLTGARPHEVLQVRPIDTSTDNKYFYVRIKGAKRGNPRTISLRRNNPMVKLIMQQARKVFPKMSLFYKYRSEYRREYTNKEGITKETVVLSGKLYWYFKKWFKDIFGEEGSISPYYLRHNRFSRMADEGFTMNEIKMWKGAKDLSSIEPYLHFSKERSRKIGGKIS